MSDEQRNLLNEIVLQKSSLAVFSRALEVAKRLKISSKILKQKLTQKDLRLSIVLEQEIFHKEQAACICFSQNNLTQALALVLQNIICLFDFETNKEIKRYKSCESGTDLITFSCDGRYLASVDLLGAIHLYDTKSKSTVSRIIGYNLSATSIVFSPNNRFLASGGRDGVISLWDRKGIFEPKKFSGHIGSVKSIAFRDDGRFFASVSDGNISVGSKSCEKSICVWSVDTGQKVRQLKGCNNIINSLTTSRDGRFIASGDDDNLVIIWDSYTGEETKRFEGHTSPVTSVAYSPDGFTIASGSHDGTLRLWDTKTEKEMQIFSGMPLLSDVGFTVDGTRVFAIGDREFYVFSTPDLEPIFKQGH